MADDSVGGIQAEVTANAGPFLAELQKAEAAAKAFDAKYGKINVTITATLAMPSQAQIQAYQRELAQKIGAAPPAARPQPTTAAQPAAAGQPATIQRPAATAAVAAEPQRPVINEALNRETALSRGQPGQRVQYQGADGNIKTAVVPSGGGAIGSGTSFAQAGLPRGPQEFAGGARGGNDPNFAFQKMQEDAARARQLERENEALRQSLIQPAAGQAGGFARASTAQRYPAGAIDPATGAKIGGTFIRPDLPIHLAVGGDQPVIITRRMQREQVRREQGALPPSQPQVSAAETEEPYVPRVLPSGEAEREHLLRAAMGEFGPQEQAAAEARLPDVPGRRRGRPSVLRTSSQRSIQRRLTPSQRVNVEASLGELFPEGLGALPDLDAVETGLIQSRQRTQNRALGTTLGGFFTGLAGGAPARERQVEAEQALAEARRNKEDLRRARNREFEIEAALFDAQKAKTPDSRLIQQITADLDAQIDTVDELASAYKESALNAASLAEEADAAAKGGLRNIGGAFAGALVGSLAFGVGMTVVSGGIELASKALGPVIERMTGYQNIAAEVTKTLAEQSRAEHGLTGVVVAETLARARLNAETAASIAPTLEGRASTEAANQAFSEQLDLFNAQIAIRNQNQAFGGDRGLFQTTGGLNILGIQTPIGGTPSTQELVGRQLAQFTPDPRARLFAPGEAGFEDLHLGLQRSITGAVESVDFLNEQLEKGGETLLRFNYVSGQVTDAQRQRAQEQAAAFEAAGAPQIASALREQEGRVLFQGQVTNQNVNRLLQAFQTGNRQEDDSLATTRLRELTIPARLFQLTAQGRLERDFGQIQAGVQRAAQPFLPLGTTVPGGLGGVSPGLQGALGAARGLDQINVGRIAAARVDISQVTSVLGPSAQAGALGMFDRLQGLGQQAAGLQTFITQSQVNLATAQYNEQLRQARLSLSDLAALTGRVGVASASNLGIAQKQVIELERQNQKLQINLSTLQLELQQRQINFQVAVAGFIAPGISPAERAARMEEAKVEAQFAQEQLDLQKQILANQAKSVPLQIQIQDIQFQRDYITALNAINLLTQGRQVTIDVAAAQEALQRVNAEIEVTAAAFQTYIQGAHQAAVAAVSDVASLIAVYGPKAIEFFDAVGGAYQDSFTSYMTHIIAQIQRGLNSINRAATQRIASGGTGGHDVGAQTGFYGRVNNPTSILVGEAGAEQVAILRNPREMLWNGGGGGQQINLTVMVTGNTVRSDQDIDRLTAEVARRVEEAIGRSASQQGFRFAAR